MKDWDKKYIVNGGKRTFLKRDIMKCGSQILQVRPDAPSFTKYTVLYF